MSDKLTVRFGSNSEHVVALQNGLLQMKLSQVGEADGAFGVKTEEAVKAMQAISSLSPDGIVGPNTGAAIDKASGFGGAVL